MPTTPNQQNSSVRISKSDMESGDPSRLNRILNLLAQKIPSDQRVEQIVQQYITNNSTSGGSGGGGGGGGGTLTGPTILSDTHANRLLSFPATSYTEDSLFWETDRTVLYICQYPSLSAGNVWQYALGTMREAYANRPTDVTTYDSGFLFYATDKQLTYRWSGTAWSIVSNFQPVIQDTHANHLSNFPSTFYPTGTTFWETDRTVSYINQDATGTLTATGTTTVTWVSGDKFDAGTNWEGKTITIDGVEHIVATTTSTTSLDTSAVVAAGVGVAFTVSSGKWQYASGTYAAALASIPTDLLSSDDGFLFAVTDYKHVLQWAESTLAWTWGPGETGGGYIQSFAVDPSPSTGWFICSGGATNYLTSAGTTTNFTTPNLTTTPAYPKFGTPYAGTINAAVAPLITGSTGAGTAHSHGVGSLANNTVDPTPTAEVLAGAGAFAVAAQSHYHDAPGITGATADESTHTHPVGTLVNGLLGEPPHIVMRPWFRR